MQLTIQNLNSLYGLYGALKDFPGLEKYQRELENLKAASEFAQEYIPEQVANTMEVEQASGIKFNLLNPEQADVANEWLKNSLKDVEKIMADKELMDKEPFLKAYLNTYKMQMNRAYSDRDDALDYYADDTAHIMIFIMDQFDKLPTEQEYQEMPENIRQTADKLINFMEAYSDCYEFQGQIQNEVEQNPWAISDEKYRQAADQKMKKLQEATQSIADIPKDAVGKFYTETGNTYRIRSNVNRLYDDKKHSPGKAAEQIAGRRKQLQSHITPVEARLLENFSGQVKGILGTAFGMGDEPEKLPQPHRKLTERIINLGKACRQKLEEGFQSEAEKLDFFKDLGEQTKAFCVGVDQAPPDRKNLTKEQNSALEGITDEFRKNAAWDIGALAQAMKMGTKIRNAERIADPEFADQIRQLCDKMQVTWAVDSGYKNSPEYTKMMNTAKVVTELVAELAGKSPLNGVQRDALGDSFGRLSKDCQAYLAKAGIGKKGREVGEDSFNYAFELLNLVDKESAERVRAESQAKVDEPQAKADEPQVKVDEPQAKADVPQAKVDEPQAKVDVPQAKDIDKAMEKFNSSRASIFTNESSEHEQMREAGEEVQKNIKMLQSGMITDEETGAKHAMSEKERDKLLKETWKSMKTLEDKADQYIAHATKNGTKLPHTPAGKARLAGARDLQNLNEQMKVQLGKHSALKREYAREQKLVERTEKMGKTLAEEFAKTDWEVENFAEASQLPTHITTFESSKYNLDKCQLMAAKVISIAAVEELAMQNKVQVKDIANTILENTDEVAKSDEFKKWVKEANMQNLGKLSPKEIRENFVEHMSKNQEKDKDLEKGKNKEQEMSTDKKEKTKTEKTKTEEKTKTKVPVPVESTATKT